MSREQSFLAAIRRLRDGPLRFLGPVWRLARDSWRAFVQFRLIARRAWLRRFAPRGPASQIHLSWQQDPSTSFTVAWWTPGSGVGAALKFREQGAQDWTTVAATSRRSPGVFGYVHNASALGLSPDTCYEYAVSNDAGCTTDYSNVYSTRTAPATTDAAYTAAFFCDTGIQGRLDGNADGTRQVIDEIGEHGPLFLLGAGDYAYANADKRYDAVGDAVDAWFRQMQPLLTRYPMMAQYGNHEIFLKECYEDWAPRFHHPEGLGDGRDYAFQVGPVFYLALFIPNPPYPTPEQLAWADEQLAAARARSVPWLVVFHHEPVFGHGSSHPAFPEIRDAIMPLMEKHAVDLHLSGHDQNYERSYPVAGGAGAFRPATLERENYRQGEGVVYAKISPAGKRSEIGNNFSQLQHPLPDVIAVHDDTAHHYAMLHVSETGIELKAYALDAGTPSRLLDSFRITRS